jgi:ABC-type antimicrobial peptide transport system permease subunit
MPTYFLPEAQADAYGMSPSLFVRASGSEESLMPALRRLTQTFVPGLPLVEVGKVRDHLEPMLAPWRLGAIAFTALGAVAIVVALVGLYAVLAFLVAERRQEFAIRAAIGGSHRQIARPVTRHALLTVAVGLLSGVILLIVAAPRVQPVLFRVSLIDPLALAGVVLAVGALAWWAAAGPARQAAREDPMNALRGD